MNFKQNIKRPTINSLLIQIIKNWSNWQFQLSRHYQHKNAANKLIAMHKYKNGIPASKFANLRHPNSDKIIKNLLKNEFSPKNAKQICLTAKLTELTYLEFFVEWFDGYLGDFVDFEGFCLTFCGCQNVRVSSAHFSSKNRNFANSFYSKYYRKTQVSMLSNCHKYLNIPTLNLESLALVFLQKSWE